MTVEQWLRQWLNVKRAELALTTHANYKHLIDRHILPTLGDKRVQVLKPSDLRELYAQLVERGYAKSTVRQVSVILSCALQDALYDEIVVRNVAQFAPLPNTKAPEKARALDVPEVRQFLAVARSHHLGVLFEVALATGLRRGEICALKWRCVDLNSGTLLVRENLPVVNGRPVPGPLKTEASARDIPLAAETVALLRDHYERQALYAPHAESFVFTNPDGSFVNPNTLSRWTRQLAVNAGLGRVRFHDLRHTHASLLLRRGVPVEVVSRHLGHTNVAFTLSRYRHVYADEGRVHAVGLSALLSGGAT